MDTLFVEMPIKQKPGQVNNFIAKVREPECNEDEKGFDDKLKRLAKAKPKQRTFGKVELVDASRPIQISIFESYSLTIYLELPLGMGPRFIY